MAVFTAHGIRTEALLPRITNWLQLMLKKSIRATRVAVLSDFAEIQYLCTGMYNGASESGILWNDPQVGIKWPVGDPILSPRDVGAQTLAQWLARPEADNFKYSGLYWRSRSGANGAIPSQFE